MAWVFVCAAADLEDEEAVPFRHGSRDAVLFLSDEGEFFCTAGHCPACQSPLAGGVLDGSVLECPACAQAFDLGDGTNEEDGPPLAVFPVRIVKGRVEADLPTDTSSV